MSFADAPWTLGACNTAPRFTSVLQFELQSLISALQSLVVGSCFDFQNVLGTRSGRLLISARKRLPLTQYTISRATGNCELLKLWCISCLHSCGSCMCPR